MKVTRIFLFSHCCLCFVPTYDLFLLPTSCCDHCHYLCDSINFPSQRLQLIGYAICCLFYLNGFHDAMLLFSNRLQMMSNCVKNKKKKWHTRGQLSVSLMFLLHFDIICNLLLYTLVVNWNLLDSLD